MQSERMEHSDNVQPMEQTPDPSAMRQLTFGEKLVGLNFNPSERQDVAEIKMLCARLADLVACMEHTHKTQEPYLSDMLKGDAMRCILHAQMAAVKYATFQY